MPIFNKLKRDKIKILYTIPNFNTAGSGKALINVISKLDKNIFEPSICCRHDKGELFKTAEDLNVPIYISSFTTVVKPRLRGIRNIYKLSRFFKRINPDIIHSYNYSDDYSEGLASKLSRIKWVYTKKNMGWGSNAWKIRSRIADMIIPQNEEMIKKLFADYEKIKLIPIGIDINEFSLNGKDSSVIKEFNLENSFPLIMTIANVIPIKGLDDLIKGFKLVLEDYENAKLLIVGENRTEYAHELESLVSTLGIGDKVIFTGRKSNIKSFLSISDLFILSSKKTGEGGPISILESMASGLITIGSDVPGIRDQFREFPEQLFESQNPGSIANKILNMLKKSDSEKQIIKDKQKEFITRNYSIDNEVEKLQKVYIKLAKYNRPV